MAGCLPFAACHDPSRELQKERLRALQAAWRDMRPVEVLTSQTGRHQPFSSPSQAMLPLEIAAALGQARIGLSDVEVNPSSAHERLLWEMLDPDPEVYLPFLEALELHWTANPGNQELGLDLAASRWVHFKQQGHLPSLLKAHEHLQKVRKQVPQSFKPMFNAALVLEALGLLDQARGCWTECLALAPDATWKREVGARLLRLDQEDHSSRWATQWQVIQKAFSKGEPLESYLEGFWEDVQMHLERVLLPGLARDVEALPLIQALAKAMGRQDPFWQDVLADLPPPGTQAFSHLSQVWSLNDQALTHLDQNREQDAWTLLQQTHNFGGHPFRLRLDYHLADLASRKEDLWPAKAQLDALVDAAHHRGYPNLEGEARWLRYSVYRSLGLPMDKVEELAMMKQLFTRAGRIDNLAGAWNLEGAYWMSLGDGSRSWHCYQRARELLAQVSKPKRHAQVYGNMSYLLESLGEVGLALASAEVALKWAEHYGEPWTLLNAQRVFWQLALKTDAPLPESINVQAMADLLLNLQEKTIAERLRMDQNLAEADFASETDYRISQLQVAIKATSAIAYRMRLPEALSQLAKAYAAQGDLKQAEEACSEAVSVYVQDAANADPAEQSKRLKHMATLLQMHLDLQLSIGDGKGAFATLEHLRSQHLLTGEDAQSPVAGSEPWRPLSLAAVQEGLPEGTSLVVFHRDGEALSAFVIGRKTFDHQRYLVDISILKPRVQRFRRQLEAGYPDNVLEQDAHEIYQTLLAPLEAFLQGQKLVIVPETTLIGLPWGSLRRETGRYLIEDFELTLAPSASAAVLTAERALNVNAKVPNSVHLLGATVFNTFDFTNLPPLEGVAEEVQELGRLLKVQPLLGRQATLNAALESLEQGGLIHWAGHAVSFGVGHRKTGFLFAPTPGGKDSGVLLAETLKDASMENVSLVVLSACATAMGSIEEMEEGYGLVQPFLARGVPNVLASLWRIRDRETAAFMLTFHQTYRREQSPARALALAQRQFLTEGCGSTSWAGFAMFGQPH